MRYYLTPVRILLLFSHSVVSDSLQPHGLQPGFPVLHHLPEPAQTHVHWVSDAIQPSHPLLSPSPPAFNLSQHQSFPVSQIFTSGGQSIGISSSASILPVNIQCWCPLGLAALISLQSKELLRVFSSAIIEKHHFVGIYGPTLTSGLTGFIFQSKGLSRVFSNTTVQKHQFFSAQPFNIGYT